MSRTLLSIISGLVLVLSIGTFVYKTKTPSTTSESQAVAETPAQAPAESTTSKGSDEYDDDEEDDDDDKEVQGQSSVPTPKPSSSSQTAGSISLATVASHNTRASCWSAIDGNVYDLTSWIPNHPGGEQRILSICGIDGSAKFTTQHGGSPKVTSILAGFKIGVLAK